MEVRACGRPDGRTDARADARTDGRTDALAGWLAGPDPVMANRVRGVSVGRAWQERMQTGASPLFNQVFKKRKKNLGHLKNKFNKKIFEN
jgi:hypothetical protein